jgi:hypothetical protein
MRMGAVPMTNSMRRIRGLGGLPTKLKGSINAQLKAVRNRMAHREVSTNTIS